MKIIHQLVPSHYPYRCNTDPFQCPCRNGALRKRKMSANIWLKSCEEAWDTVVVVACKASVCYQARAPPHYYVAGVLAWCLLILGFKKETGNATLSSASFMVGYRLWETGSRCAPWFWDFRHHKLISSSKSYFFLQSKADLKAV